MKSNTLFFSLIFCATFIATPSREQAVDLNDSLALVDLYNSTNGPSWTKKQNWLNGPVSTWQGVTVSDSRVISLNMGYNNMSGPLPSSIGNITELVSVFFSVNKLTGSVPSSIGNLIKLTSFQLSGNQFTGNIPSSIGNLVQLVQLNLDGNNFTGAIPASIGNLANVIYLYLNGNQLSGSIPSSIGGLASVILLYLNDNELTGSIPASIGNLKNLQTISLINNKLTGSIPYSIGNLSSITGIVFNNNQLTGSIPNSIGKLSTLEVINFSDNHLSGNLPASIGNLTNLRYLQIQNNRFTGTLPVTMRKLTNLGNLTINENLFTDSGYIDLPVTAKRKMNGDLANNHFIFNTLEFVAQKFPFLVYNPQLNISIHQDDNTLSVSAGGKLSNNTYKWYKVGTITPTVITGDSTFQPSESGAYYAEVTNAVATRLTLNTDTISFTASLATNKQDQKLSIYPNPVNDVLTINGFDMAFAGTITISDIRGNIKLTTTAKKQVPVQINVSSLKPGNYIMYAGVW